MRKQRQVAHAGFFKRHDPIDAQSWICTTRRACAGQRENVGERKMPIRAEEGRFSHGWQRGRG
jgi:hypothetical protein